MNKSMNKKRIGIVFGGCSPEYNVSLESAYSVITNINMEKYDIVLIGIDKKGDMFYYNGDIEDIKNDKWRDTKNVTKAVISNNKSDKGIIVFYENGVKQVKLDAIFPILHGKNGEDGTIQGLIELSGIPLIGCGILSSSLCMDKYLSHKLVESYGINVARSILIDAKTSDEKIRNKLSSFTYPLFVKPLRAGSSFGITKVRDYRELKNAINKAFIYDTEIIIEENVDGIEIGCAILGSDELIVGKIDEIEIDSGFFDYEEKYTLKSSKIHVPARINESKCKEAIEIAKKIYKILKCKDFARVDMFLAKNGDIYFNEINTIPGFTSHSRYPNMMKKVGLDFKTLIEKLIEQEV